MTTFPADDAGLRELARQIAKRAARANPPSYYTEDFEPHEWVIEAVMEAYRQATEDCVASVLT